MSAPQLAPPRPEVIRAPRRPLTTRDPVRRRRPRTVGRGTYPVTPFLELSTHPVYRARRRLVRIIALGFIGFALANLLISTMLAMNIYRIAGLKAQLRDLQLKVSIVEAEVARLDSPQHLDAEAHKLGMVASNNFGYLSLETGKVTGTPSPAGATP